MPDENDRCTCPCPSCEAYWTAQVGRLSAEVERLREHVTTLVGQLVDAEDLQAEVERLREAGDRLADASDTAFWPGDQLGQDRLRRALDDWKSAPEEGR